MSGPWQLFLCLFLGSPRLGLSGDALKWSNHSNLPFAPLTSPLLQRHDILAQPVWSGISASAIPITHSFFLTAHLSTATSSPISSLLSLEIFYITIKHSNLFGVPRIALRNPKSVQITRQRRRKLLELVLGAFSLRDARIIRQEEGPLLLYKEKFFFTPRIDSLSRFRFHLCILFYLKSSPLYANYIPNQFFIVMSPRLSLPGKPSGF